MLQTLTQIRNFEASMRDLYRAPVQRLPQERRNHPCRPRTFCQQEFGIPRRGLLQCAHTEPEGAP
ncbi:MAG: hypothetical protein ABIJ09_25665 [Pseudomonadota bacterium]